MLSEPSESYFKSRQFLLKRIAPFWETERLFARDAILETDVDDLQKLRESTAYLGAFDGHPERQDDDMYNDLTLGDLPPGGTKQLFKIQPVFTKEQSEMVGLNKTYHGYPNDMTVGVAFFCVSSTRRKKLWS